MEISSKIRPRYSVLSCDKIRSKINFECKWEEELIFYLNKFYVKRQLPKN